MKDLFTWVVCTFWDAWFYMLGAGILHSFYHQVPPVGYWVALVFAAFFTNPGASLMIIRRLDEN